MTRTDAEKAPAYTAEFWTTIGQIKEGKHVTHDHWVVLNAVKEVVAAGGEEFCKEYADSLNIQAAYRKQTGETGRSVPQFSDPAGE